jgi:hypothetical protein
VRLAETEADARLSIIMFDDETIDIKCPGCGHRNPVPVREFESNPEQHIECERCKTHIRIEGTEFKHRLEEIDAEVKELERAGSAKLKRAKNKGDFQI